MGGGEGLNGQWLNGANWRWRGHVISDVISGVGGAISANEQFVSVKVSPLNNGAIFQ